MRPNCFSLTYPALHRNKPEITIAVVGWNTAYKLEMSSIAEEAQRVYNEHPSVMYDNDRLWHEAVWKEVELRQEKSLQKLRDCDVFCWVELKMNHSFFSGDLT